MIQIRNRHEMVAAKMPAAAALARRPIHNVFPRPVIIVRVLITNLAPIITQIPQIKVSRRNVLCGIPQIPRNG